MRLSQQPDAEALNRQTGSNKGNAQAERGQQNERGERNDESGYKQQTGSEPQTIPLVQIDSEILCGDKYSAKVCHLRHPIEGAKLQSPPKGRESSAVDDL